MDEQLLDDVTRRLCAAAPEDFTSLRRELAAQASDDQTATAIGKVRKPTNAARVVNALVAHDPGVADRLRELGDRMRSAQDELDAARMRELTAQRRTVVGACAQRALDLAGLQQPAGALRDDVLGTFDAAVADPDVAARLGTLQRPERFSGFGFGGDASAGPQLTLVRGGGGDARPATKRPKVSAAERRKQQRALADAQALFDTADTASDDATRAERDALRIVSRRERELGKAKAALDDARAALDDSRAAAKDARAARRDARSALDREQRRAPD